LDKRGLGTDFPVKLDLVVKKFMVGFLLERFFRLRRKSGVVGERVSIAGGQHYSTAGQVSEVGFICVWVGVKE